MGYKFLAIFKKYEKNNKGKVYIVCAMDTEDQ